MDHKSKQVDKEKLPFTVTPPVMAQEPGNFYTVSLFAYFIYLLAKVLFYCIIFVPGTLQLLKPSSFMSYLHFGHKLSCFSSDLWNFTSHLTRLVQTPNPLSFLFISHAQTTSSLFLALPLSETRLTSMCCCSSSLVIYSFYYTSHVRVIIAFPLIPI